MKLKGKIAIVTGGTGGIGSAMVNALLREGARVTVIDHAPSLESLRNARSQGVVVLRADVSRLADVKKAVKTVVRKYKRIDVLVNCAGVLKPIGPFLKNEIRAWEKLLRINLLGTVMMCHEAAPYMARRKRGSIINFSGGGATFSRPNFSAYAVSKIAVVKFTEILADELKQYGVRVNSIAPGAVNTQLLTQVLEAGNSAGGKEFNEAQKRVKEGGTPPELAAELIVFLASDASRELSGKLISAVWDDWKHWNAKRIRKIMQSEAFTLRRLKENGTL